MTDSFAQTKDATNVYSCIYDLRARQARLEQQIALSQRELDLVRTEISNYETDLSAWAEAEGQPLSSVLP